MTFWQSDRTSYTRSGLRFRPESPRSTSNSEFEEETESTVLGSTNIAAPCPYFSDMDDLYGAGRGLRRFSGRVGTIELVDFKVKFFCWCEKEKLKHKADFTPFTAWVLMFKHLEGAPMDDYKDFNTDHTVEIEAFREYWSPTHMPFMFDKKSTTELDEFTFNEASSSRKVAPKFNPILEFFEVLEKGY
ncbi:unnamed protein product [Calypogeia fissa]